MTSGKPRRASALRSSSPLRPQSQEEYRRFAGPFTVWDTVHSGVFVDEREKLQCSHVVTRQAWQVANIQSQLISIISYLSPGLNVLQSLSHWLHNSPPSSFLKMSSTPNLALTSPSVSNLSFDDSKLVSTSTLRNAVSVPLHGISPTGSSGASQAKCLLLLSLFSVSMASTFISSHVSLAEARIAAKPVSL